MEVLEQLLRQGSFGFPGALDGTRDIASLIWNSLPSARTVSISAHLPITRFACDLVVA
jgi:hypothetical protein